MVQSIARRFAASILLVAVLLFFSAVATAQEAQSPADWCAAATPAETPENRSFSNYEQVIDDNTDYRAIFCTSVGPIYVDLYEALTPVTVNNFVFLAQQGYYNNTIFHRVIENFMAQGGDPTGTGIGGPGYQFEDEFVSYLVFDRPGLVAMANAGPGTNGSQFFITTVPTPHLDFAHTIFGEVLEGQENVLNIELRDPTQRDAPATTLDTVLIVQPEQVITTFEETTFTGEDIITAFDELQEGLNLPEFTLEGGDVLLDTQTVAKTAPKTLVREYETQLTANNHEYSIVHSLTNEACDVETYPFVSIGYTFDSFASTADAKAFLDSGILAQVAEAEGFVADGTDDFFTKPVRACDDTLEAIEVRYIKRVGRYIEIASAVVPVDDRFTPQQITEFIVLRLYEQVVRDFLRSQIRAG